MSITHSILRTFVAGGVTEYPSEATPILGDHEGLTLEAGDGTPTNVWTGTKRRWEYRWNSPRPEIVARWLTRYKARTTFATTDPDGGAYTALLPVGGVEIGYQYQADSTTATGTTYTLTVRVWEA
jgi:hypothetical protein